MSRHSSMFPLHGSAARFTAVQCRRYISKACEHPRSSPGNFNLPPIGRGSRADCWRKTNPDHTTQTYGKGKQIKDIHMHILLLTDHCHPCTAVSSAAATTSEGMHYAKPASAMKNQQQPSPWHANTCKQPETTDIGPTLTFCQHTAAALRT
jgi:hypothetical protein